jgi:hypothetical protein
MTQCTSRPDCPCDFCERLRIEHFCYKRDREMDAEMLEERRFAEEFLRSYPRDK